MHAHDMIIQSNYRYHIYNLLLTRELILDASVHTKIEIHI